MIFRFLVVFLPHPTLLNLNFTFITLILANEFPTQNTRPSSMTVACAASDSDAAQDESQA